MKIILPDGQKVSLDTTLTYEERLNVVNKINEEWEDHFRDSWNNNSVKICLEVLANYLLLSGKEREDKEIMSMKKMKQMVRGDRKSTAFSSLSYSDKMALGLADDVQDME
jgi:hypothetical protein